MLTTDPRNDLFLATSVATIIPHATLVPLAVWTGGAICATLGANHGNIDACPGQEGRHWPSQQRVSHEIEISIFY